MNDAERRQATLRLLGIVAILWLAFVLTGRGQRFDDTAKVFTTLHHLGRRFARAGMPIVGKVGTAVAVTSGIVALVVVACAAVRDIGQRLVVAVSIVVPPVAFAEILKLALPHPELSSMPRWIGASTYPSGHTAFSVGAALAALTLVSSKWRPVTLVWVGVVTFSIQCAVIVSGQHRPSDALGGALVATAWWLVATGWVTEPNAVPARDPHETLPRRPLHVAAAVAACGFVLAATVGPHHYPPSLAAGDRAAVAAGLLFAANTMVVMWCATWAVRDRTLSESWPQRVSRRGGDRVPELPGQPGAR